MRKILIIVAAAAAAQAWAANLDCNNAWVGGTRQNPVNWNPKELAAKGQQLTATQREKINVNDDE